MKFFSFFLTASVAFLAATQANAQTPARWAIALDGGLAVPVGHFASTRNNDPDAGYAKTGSAFGVSGNYRIRGGFGVRARVAAAYAEFDRAARVAQNPAYETEISPGTWRTYAALAGPSFARSFGRHGRFSWQAALLAGLAKARMPRDGDIYPFNFRVGYQGNENQLTIRMLPAVFAWSPEAGVRAALGNHWFAGLDLRYFATATAHASFYFPENTGSFDPMPLSAGVETSSSHRFRMNTAGLALNLGFRF